jgi:hypothetical protein
VILDLKKLGLGGELTAVERWRGGEMPVRDGAAAVRIPPYHFLLLEVSEAPARGPELLVNPGFEKVSDADAPPDGWGQYPGSKGTVTTVADAGAAHRGSYYLKVECPTNLGVPACRIDAACTPTAGRNGRAAVEGDGRYAISYWARGTGEVALGVYEYNDEAWLPPTIALEPAQVDTERWQRYDAIYSPSPKGKFPARGGRAALLADFGFTVQGAVCLDDFSFRKVEEKQGKQP